MMADDLWHPRPSRIAIFRALQLGDMLCSVPALRALRQHCPDAHITLIGLDNAAPFVRRFNRYIDDLLPFPGIPAFPEQTARPYALPAFYREVQARRFDMALQMHGSGTLSLPIARALGARFHAGFVPHADMARPGRLMPWPDHLPEPLRYTGLMRFLGVPVYSDALELPLFSEDREEARLLASQARFEPETTVFIHPGARLRSRRWPAERYARIAAALSRGGWRIAVTGSEGERALTAEVMRGAGARAVDLTGRTSLGGLAALLSRAPLLVCNDTGVSHIAAAVGTRSVVVACGSDTHRWAPLDSARHTVIADHPPCRPCAHDTCPIGHVCALNVSVDTVLHAIAEKLDEDCATVVDGPVPAGARAGEAASALEERSRHAA